MENEESKFKAYVKVQMSGKTNMFDTLRVRELAWSNDNVHMTRDDVLFIMNNYSTLKEKYND